MDPDIMESWSNYQERIDCGQSENEDDLEDLAELEALLYSQIHYSQDEQQIAGDLSMNDTRNHRTIDSSFSVKSYVDLGLEPPNEVTIDDQIVGEVGKELLDKVGDDCSDVDSGCGESRAITPFVDSIDIDSEDEEKIVDEKLKDEEDFDVENGKLLSEEESRYSSVKSKQVESQVISSDSDSDDSEDDGIVVIPKPLKPEPELICLDSSSPPLSISSDAAEDSSSDDDENIQENPFFDPKNKTSNKLKKSKQNDSVVILTESTKKNEASNDSIVILPNSTSPPKNNSKEIRKVLKKTKSKPYKIATDSDSSDSYSDNLSDSSIECLDTDMALGNVLGTSCSNRKRKMISMSDILGKDIRDVVTIKNMKCYSWTDQMDKFYNDIIPENVDVELEDILDKIPKRANFDINRADVYGGGVERRRYFQGGVKCHNCGQFGHMVRFCSEPQKAIHCRMCGGVGHYETRCPTKCCLGCGQPGGMFLESCLHCRNKQQFECKECGERGHLKKDCSDLWRRYHITTEPGAVFKPFSDIHKNANKAWCCNCGKKGHLVDGCRRYLYSKYPAPNLTVVSYAEPATIQDFDSPDKNKGNNNKKAEQENVAYVPKTFEKYRSSPFVSKFLKSQPQSYGEPKPKKQRKEEQRELKKAEKKRNKQAVKLGVFHSEPGSPTRKSVVEPLKKTMSEPSSPYRNNQELPASSLVEKAIEKLSGKEKWKVKRQAKRDNKKIFKLAKIVGDKSDVNQLLKDYEVDVEAMTKCLKNKNSNKKQKKVNKENANFFRKEIQERQAEFGDKRGFGKKTDFKGKFNEGQMRPSTNSNGFIKLKGEVDFPRNKNEKADIIPGNVKAAIRVLNREVNTEVNFPGSKKIKKELRSEIWCLRNSLAQTDQLKKVERIRLAGMVLQLKNMS